MASKASKKAAKAKIDTSLFKQLAPRMMRDLMRDFSPLAEFQAAAVVGNGGGESGGFMLIQELKPTVPGSKGGSASFNGPAWAPPRSPAAVACSRTCSRRWGASPTATMRTMKCCGVS